MNVPKGEHFGGNGEKEIVRPGDVCTNHVAWLRYVSRQDNPDLKTIETCDSDADGAFKVYRRVEPNDLLKLAEETIRYAVNEFIKMEVNGSRDSDLIMGERLADVLKTLRSELNVK